MVKFTENFTSFESFTCSYDRKIFTNFYKSYIPLTILPHAIGGNHIRKVKNNTAMVRKQVDMRFLHLVFFSVENLYQWYNKIIIKSNYTFLV